MINQTNKLTLRDVWNARKKISCIVKKTPLVHSPFLSDKTNASIYLKLENMHAIGAFKIRGAANKILSLSKREQQKGVTTFSTGNHGLAVAYVAQHLGIKAVICISNNVPDAKVKAIKRLGAQLEVSGESQDDAEQRCNELQDKYGLTVIKPFDDPYVITGQGTMGLEIIEELPGIDLVIGGLSGGGLLSGLGLTLKSIDNDIKIVGLSMEDGAVMHHSLHRGQPITLAESKTLADSLLGGIGLDNQYTFHMIQQYLDRSLLVSEDVIAEGMAIMLKHHRMMIEGAAAIGIGAILHQPIVQPGETAVIVISGQNVDFASHLKAIQKYLI